MVVWVVILDGGFGETDRLDSRSGDLSLRSLRSLDLLLVFMRCGSAVKVVAVSIAGVAVKVAGVSGALDKEDVEGVLEGKPKLSRFRDFLSLSLDLRDERFHSNRTSTRLPSEFPWLPIFTLSFNLPSKPSLPPFNHRRTTHTYALG